MEILSDHERQLIEVAKFAAAGDFSHKPEGYRAFYQLHNPSATVLQDSAIIADLAIGRAFGMLGALAAALERVTAQAEAERARADQAERHNAELMSLADDAVTVAVRLGSHAVGLDTEPSPADPDDSGAWGVRS